MMYFIFALLILICILTVVCYALLVIASEEEREPSGCTENGKRNEMKGADDDTD